ncbi:MAG: 2-hydroxyacid dehydrogenase [Prevotella sp.]|jgi:D-lactate dehydrogenase|uniref:2-hydroxyacid dehydrogenase n=1 Tax=Prevotella vespertina TaxID=2608404 RepID=A0A7C9LAC1_9BACT|nr:MULTISPECIES: 2-hydroxyacid dehydrogenase [Prevotella]EID32450.1 4-phosphoerythronate dehydrogenase [Prevotella sp. oral taxon 306 str. F0472]MBF1625847.1 2-hydroxyacid dehydrogenase [Prevotella sp.]MBF1637880.1 2-hydroxyacid dehydrogenase [Prevotella sp.]MUL27814.1 2-hydroxyacid dehydrogenase [Prevotella vespertina]
MALRIAFFDAKSYDIESFNAVNKDYNFDIRYYQERLSISTVPLAKGADVVCIFVNAECDAQVIDELINNGVKLIALRCAGFNNVDLKAAEGRIRVTRVPAYSPHAVAEYAVSLMLSLNRKIYRAVNRTRDGNFTLNGLLGFDMYGKTAGVIGMGRIAKELIKILHGFGMNVMAYDLYPDHEFAKQYDVKVVSLDELYANSDIISLHCPLTPDTKFLINQDSIAKMKKGVMIINTGRGKLINTEDLIEGLRSKQVGSAGLDVYEEEREYFYEDKSDKMIDDDVLARLLMVPNVVLTSHQAFFTAEALHNIAVSTLDSVKEFAEGKDLTCEVKNA